MSKPSGWEREYRNHFDDIVEQYENIRPDWPDGIYSDIFNYAKPNKNDKALEIGVGTGKATTNILNMGYSVTAIEVNPNMAAFSSNRFNNYDIFQVITSSFEDVSLPDDHFDLIYAASAFHWVDANVGLPKSLRLLKQGGAIALFRYNEIAAPANELYNNVRKIHNKYYDAFYNISFTEPIRKSHNDFCTPEEIYKGFRFKSLQTFGFRDVCMKFYDVKLEFTAGRYISLLDTLSDHRNLPDSIKKPFYEETREEIERSGGKYEVDYVFQLYLGRK